MTWLGPLWFAIIAKIFDKQIGLRADFSLYDKRRFDEAWASASAGSTGNQPLLSMYTSARQCCALVMSPDLPSDFVTFESATRMPKKSRAGNPAARASPT
jgi:hypothetical protein